MIGVNVSEPTEKKSFHKRPLPFAVASMLFIAGAIFGVRYYIHAMSHESTDDAFIEGHIIPASPKVAGHILKVYITDNQEVKKGDLLAEIDPRDFEVKLLRARAALREAISKQKAAQINVGMTDITSSAGVQQASSGVQFTKSAVQTVQAQVAGARNRIDQSRAQVATALANAEQEHAQVVAAEAEAMRADIDLQRYQQLYESGVTSRQQLDHGMAAARSANARLEAARKKVASAEAGVVEARAAQQSAAESLRQAESQLSEAHARVGEALGHLAEANAAPQQVALSKSQAETAGAEIEQAQAAVQQADLELSYTKIYAPESGRVTRKMAEEGAFVQIGQFLMAIVSREVWVIANFKETQLTHMRPGQPVRIQVDAYPNKVLKGHVDSIQSGSGARFSLLPPENATGNYVKVVQRVPVKIVFDQALNSDHRISPGMSVVPEVEVSPLRGIGE